MDYSSLYLAVNLLVYILACRLVMRWSGGVFREAMLTLFSLAGVYLFFFKDLNNDTDGHVGNKLLVEYVGIVIFQYVLLRLFSNSNMVITPVDKTKSDVLFRLFSNARQCWLGWLAFFCPITFLILIRYLPYHDWERLLRPFHTLTGHWLAIPYVIGISYMAFRCSRLVLEVRNGDVKMPGMWAYLNFSFFLPTMSLGPINTYANHRRGFEATRWEVPIGRPALRILVGLVKYEFLGSMASQLAYTGLLRNGHLHHWIDLPVAMVFYYLYLYCNFSGFCDMVIGAAALIGIPVLENFNNPFAARNIKDFWNRWHITLSHWMRDIVFAPLSKFLVRVMGPPMANHAIAITITVVFLLVGIWHGVGWNYAAFGAMHALGLVINHYYTVELKKRLGREGFKAYMENRWIHAAAVVLTFAYCAASLMFFANTFPQIKEIFRVLR